MVTCDQEMLNGTAKVSVTEYDEGGFVVNDVVRCMRLLESRLECV